MNILITGTSSGFGNVMARTLSMDGGHHVIATMRGTAGRNAGAAAELSVNDAISVRELDVTDQQQVDGIVDEVLDTFGSIDVLINNAGVMGMGLTEAYSVDQIRRVFEVNFYGPVRMLKAVLPGMRSNRSGLIINISSTLGVLTIPRAAAYCASKHALEGYVQSSYPELIRLGVENILLEPGPFPTELGSNQNFNADEPDILASCAALEEELKREDGAVMASIDLDALAKPQQIADIAAELIRMESGKRPLRTMFDPVSGKALSDRITSALAGLQQDWRRSYGEDV